MSENFFKHLCKEEQKYNSGKLFIVVNDENKNLKGEKMFSIDDKTYYSDNKYQKFWDTVLTEIEITSPKIYKLSDGTKIFAERLKSKPTIILCGGGHISLFVYQVALMIDFDVVIIDDREEFANKNRFPHAREIICGKFEDCMANMDYGENSYYIIVTRGHSHDGLCLMEAMKKDNSYIGMIGSRKKVKIIKNFLAENNFTQEEIEKIYTPIGVSIGAETPQEIAVSIMAEVISVYRGDKATSSVSDEVLEFLARAKEKVALVMILNKEGSIPRGAGAKMAVTEDGSIIGTIGGGAIEYEAKLKAMEILAKNLPPYIEKYSMDNNDAKKEGMACGGSAILYIEAIN